MTVRDFGNASLAGACLGAVVFVVLYLRSPWWKSPTGRNIMAMMALIAVLLGLAVMSAVFGLRYPAREWVRAASFLLVAIVVWQRAWLLYRVQREDRRQRRRDRVR